MEEIEKKGLSEEEIARWKRIKAGDTEERNRFIEENLGLARKAAADMSKKCPKNGVFDFNDLYGECCLVLTDAVDRFDYQQGNRFSTFVMAQMKFRLMNYTGTNSFKGSMNHNDCNEINEIKKIIMELQAEQESESEPDAIEIANRWNEKKQTKITVKRVKDDLKIIYAKTFSISLTDEDVGNGEILESEIESKPVDFDGKNEGHHQEIFTTQERKYYNLLNAGYKMEEIAEKIGLSEEKIRQIEAEVRRKELLYFEKNKYSKVKVGYNPLKRTSWWSDEEEETEK